MENNQVNSMDVNMWLKTQKELTSFVYHRVKDKALAEDIVQDVFLKVYTSIGSLRESEKITGWIYRITRNAIVDHFRKHSNAISNIDLNTEGSEMNYNDCVAGCLRDMLQQLPDKYREALELTEFENLSQLQLAERLQISYSGAKSRVQRARQILRERMEETYHIQLDSYGNAITCKNRLPCGCD